MRAGIVTVVRKRPWLSLGICPKPTAPTVPSWPLWNTRSVLVEADPRLLQLLPSTVTLVPTGPLLGETTNPTPFADHHVRQRVGEVDDDPGRVGELQDPEADPLGHADPGGGLALKGAGGVDLAQGLDQSEIPAGQAYQLSIRHPDGSTQQLDISEKNYRDLKLAGVGKTLKKRGPKPGSTATSSSTTSSWRTPSVTPGTGRVSAKT
jgi:hypothetical protein